MSVYQIFVGKRPDGFFAVKRVFSHHFGHRTMISSVASRHPRSSTNTGDDKDDMDGNEDEDNDDDADDKDDDSDASFNTAKSSVEDNDDDTGTVDKLFEDLLKERNGDAFLSLEDIDPIIDLYEKISGNHLSKHSFRQYVCKEHVNCTFQIFVGRHRGDGMFSLKRIDARHSEEPRDARARDGQMWKQRRCGKLDNMIVQVVRTKKEKPTPADVVKTAATQLGEVVPYMTAYYRALHSEIWEQKYMQRKKIELIILYIEALRKANAGSVIGYSWDDNKCMSSIHVFPGFMNESLSYVRPVVSLDAAHLKGVHKGTLVVRRQRCIPNWFSDFERERVC